jgi:CRISPR-associated Csx3 family protein
MIARGEKMAIVIDVEALYGGEVAKISDTDEYAAKALEAAGEGNEIVLTGRGPVWLYLLIAHALHGKARKLSYDSPVTGEVVVFNHNPF